MKTPSEALIDNLRIMAICIEKNGGLLLYGDLAQRAINANLKAASLMEELWAFEERHLVMKH